MNYGKVDDSKTTSSPITCS